MLPNIIRKCVKRKKKQKYTNVYYTRCHQHVFFINSKQHPVSLSTSQIPILRPFYYVFLLICLISAINAQAKFSRNYTKVWRFSCVCNEIEEKRKYLFEKKTMKLRCGRIHKKKDGFLIGDFHGKREIWQNRVGEI